MKHLSSSSVRQQYQSLLHYIRVLRTTRQWNSLPESRKQTLLGDVRALLGKLKSILPSVDFKKWAAAAAMIAGLSYTSNAQFATPLADPFGYQFIDTLVFPTTGDMDNDGDFDLFVGNKLGDIFYMQNTGTVSAPAFAASQTNPFGLTNIGNGYMTFPSLADMDNDGDLDMWVGDFYGNTFYFENTGTTAAPAYGAAQQNPFSITVVPYNATPVAADMDNDGDLDLFIGDYYGDTHYFENTGTASAPSFGAAQINAFGLITVNYNSDPAAADLDNDGDTDVLIGDFYGDLHYFKNTGTVTAPAFGPSQINPFNLSNLGYYVSPVFADMDNDSDPDLFVGESYGVLYYFENLGGIGISEAESNEALSVFPNPASQQVTFVFSQVLPQLTIELRNTGGQIVHQQVFKNQHQVALGIEHIAAGIYTAHVKTQEGTRVYRLIKQ